jgi:hypothetical protein
MNVARLCRHPIKSVGFEEVAEVILTEGQAFPFDREWAVAHAAAKCGANPTGWHAKLNFLRGWGSADLMAVSCVSDVAARRLTLCHPRQTAITVNPDDPADQPRLIDWLRPLWPSVRPEPATVVHVPGQAMTDVPEPYLAVLNLASLGDLSARMGQDLSIHRWRGNIWLAGLAPWAEFDWIGREITLGGARLVIERRITRCRAIGANPETGQQDAAVLETLETGYGHQNFGVYATVVGGGRVAVGDRVTL